jgi:stage V sporulation protein G
VEITEVRIKLMDDPHDRLQAFCSITFDGCFVIRDLKIIQGAKGSFVAMPSRKLTDRCPRCGQKNHLRSQYCNQCGSALKDDRAVKDDDGRAKLYADIAHPINSHCREMIQQQVIRAYEEELIKAQQPGYVCTYDDYGEDSFAALREEYEDLPAPVRFQTADDRSHRIEPAAAQHAAPHHGNGARPRSHEPVKVAHADRSDSEDDAFAAGIV